MLFDTIEQLCEYLKELHRSDKVLFLHQNSVIATVAMYLEERYIVSYLTIRQGNRWNLIMSKKSIDASLFFLSYYDKLLDCIDEINSDDVFDIEIFNGGE